MQFSEKLAMRMAAAGLSVPRTALDGLEAYFELLRKWNRRVSLTSLPVAEAADGAIDRILIEPVLAAAHLPLSAPAVIDIGSGGGSPAIPMKLVVPEMSMVMVESRGKKAAFLRECARALPLDRTTVESTRFEELLSRPAIQFSADVVTLRAVKVDENLLTGVQGFLKPGGLLYVFSSDSQTAVRPPPGLEEVAIHPLLPQLGSRLEILRKGS